MAHGKAEAGRGTSRPINLYPRDRTSLTAVPKTESPVVDPKLEQRANEFVQKLLEIRPEDIEAQELTKASVETMSIDLQKRAAEQTQFLAEPIKRLSTQSQEGGEVANALIDLKNQVEELDPGKFDFEAGWFTRALGRLPGVGTPMKRYFSKFENAQTVIAAIIRSLEDGRGQLERDNITLAEDQRQMREMTYKLQQAIDLAQLIDSKLQSKLDTEIIDQDKRRFMSEELLFPLRQRIIDLQQQLAVNQQAVLSTEIIIRNNKELMRGVDRSLSVTITALQVAATVAIALTHQRIVLDKIDSVNRTTSDLISGTAARLKTQGVEIQKQATNAQL
ncbi:MAG: toxic anion resistance protein, partial [Bdellovibrionia bacterium]